MHTSKNLHPFWLHLSLPYTGFITIWVLLLFCHFSNAVFLLNTLCFTTISHKAFTFYCTVARATFPQVLCITTVSRNTFVILLFGEMCDMLSVPLNHCDSTVIFVLFQVSENLQLRRFFLRAYFISFLLVAGSKDSVILYTQSSMKLHTIININVQVPQHVSA